ncbi:MAG: formyltransferase family protein, partial [Pricia sp.]
MIIGLLTDKSLTDFNLNALKPILQDSSLSIKVALIDARPEKSSYQKLKKNLRRGRGGYVVIMAFKSLFSKEIDTDTKVFCKTHNIDVIETKKPYSQETLESIKAFNLDVLCLLGGYGIVKKQLLEITPMGVLSYHHGNMRTYRGMPPALWELYNNEEEMGVTVQILTSGLDCGTAIVEKVVK